MGVKSLSNQLSKLVIFCAICIPLIMQAAPIVWFNISSLLMGCLLLAGLINFRSSISYLIKPDYFLIIFLLYFLSMCLGLALSTEKLNSFVLRDIAWGFCLLGLTVIVFSSLTTLIEKKLFVTQISLVVVIVGTIISLVGCLKYLLLSEGSTMGFVQIAWFGRTYPAGSSLSIDYNFFSLTLLISSFASLTLWRKSSSLFMILSFGICFSIMLIMGYLSGSRRFFIVATLIYPILFILFLRAEPTMKFQRLIILIISFTLVFFIILIFDNYVNVSKLLENSYHFGPGTGLVGRDLGYDYIVTVYQTLTFKEESFGLGSRFERWQYGIELSSSTNFLYGGGFDYLNKFGCKFNAIPVGDNTCDEIGYPHSPILSAFLYGGLIAFLSTLALLIYCSFIGLKLLLFSNEFFEWGAALLSTMLFTFISGNTYFSMPVFFIILTVSVFACRSEVKNDF